MLFHPLALMLIVICIFLSLLATAMPVEDSISQSGGENHMEGSDIQNSPLLQYMKELQSTIADEDGVPSQDLAASPTSVFCLADSDIVNRSVVDSYRRSRCSSTYKFVFELDPAAGQGNKSLPLTKVRLRVYKESIDRHILNGIPVAVNVSALLRLTPKDSDAEHTLTNGTSWEFLRTIEVATRSDGWLEFELGQQLEAPIWGPVVGRHTVDITLKFSINCNKQRKVPLKIINSATIGSGKKLRYQPFLVVFLDDIEIKRMIEMEPISVLEDDEAILSEEYYSRAKRQSGNQLCQLKDFRVDFRELNFDSIIYPQFINIKQCVGGCSLNNLQVSVHIATNHARILTSAYHIYRERGSSQMPAPKEPCCSAISYKPAYLLSYNVINGRLENNLEPDMVVKACGCR